ncbi:MAG: RagB/SusD family nutrient uptake outer membrane protein [Paenibacillus sp.]|nr:RagB/SusD family nutrient uptake outer membrane protein [Paenibacillus sp.]
MKYNKILATTASALSLMAMSSCDGWLDNQPKGFTIPEKYEDYEQLMNSQYLYRALDIYPSFITDDIQLVATGTIPNFSLFEYRDKSEHLKNLYSFQHGQVFTPGNSDGIWEDAYSNIFTYNAVINNVLTSAGGSADDRNHLMGEALVGRAFEYLNLVNLYGNHYDPATADSDYGVPLVLSEEITGEKYPRASVAQVYAQIESDLNNAVDNYLAASTATSFDPDRSVGFAFLSRMYLYMGRYADALSNANSSLALNDKLLDYKDYTTKQGQWGRIVAADGSGDFPDEHDNLENVYTRILNGTSYIFKSVAASEDLLDTFARNLPADGEDMRLSLFFAKDEFNPYTVGGSPDQFIGYTIFAPYIEMNIGFSTPEVLLIAAECEARVGDKDKALAHLDKLRDMRIKNNVHFSTDYTKEEVLKMVIDERRKEFAFIGLTRLIDLKRLNRESWFAKTITHSAGNEGTWELPANDPRYIMPVPDNVLSFNNMPQYER